MNHNTKYLIRNTSQSGFAVLMSTIILSAIMLAVVFSLNFSGFFTRFNLRDSENKERSLAMAEACAQVAVLKINQEPTTYAGNETLSLSSNNCTIRPIPTASPIVYPRVIQTTATDSGAVSNIVVDLDSNLSVIRWREVDNF